MSRKRGREEVRGRGTPGSSFSFFLTFLPVLSFLFSFLFFPFLLVRRRDGRKKEKNEKKDERKRKRGGRKEILPFCFSLHFAVMSCWGFHCREQRQDGEGNGDVSTSIAGSGRREQQ